MRRQRLHLIANNARFLILPGESFPNLASRLLALNLRRLSADWQAAYRHPIVLAETFVESPRFTGACYRAANWIEWDGPRASPAVLVAATSTTVGPNAFCFIPLNPRRVYVWPSRSRNPNGLKRLCKPSP
ncbi:MAG: DUF4338 domain-containing protein [Planctomycetia bacterium]|nr:DUF4338 domain-containing protein [Planctomycetia bacterium]